MDQGTIEQDLIKQSIGANQLSAGGVLPSIEAFNVAIVTGSGVLIGKEDPSIAISSTGSPSYY